MAIHSFSYKGYLMGRVKFNLPNLAKNTRSSFRPRKIVFLNHKKKSMKIKGGYVQTSLNFWKRGYLLRKETCHLYGFRKSSQTRHYLKILSKGDRLLFSKIESQLNVLLVRVGWASDLTDSNKLITSGWVSVNGAQTRSKLKCLKPGSVVTIKKKPLKTFSDNSLLPHVSPLGYCKFILVKDPQFCPETLYFDLKTGLKNLC